MPLTEYEIVILTDSLLKTFEKFTTPETCGETVKAVSNIVVETIKKDKIDTLIQVGESIVKTLKETEKST